MALQMNEQLMVGHLCEFEQKNALFMIDDCIFTRNKATNGGAIHAKASSFLAMAICTWG